MNANEKITEALAKKYSELTGYPMVEFGEHRSKFKMPSGKIVGKSYKDLTIVIDFKTNKSVTDKPKFKKLGNVLKNKDLTVPLNARIRGSLMTKLKKYATEHHLSLSKVIDRLVDECI
jgi:hypothetical protein